MKRLSMNLKLVVIVLASAMVTSVLVGDLAHGFLDGLVIGFADNR